MWAGSRMKLHYWRKESLTLSIPSSIGKYLIFLANPLIAGHFSGTGLPSPSFMYGTCRLRNCSQSWRGSGSTLYRICVHSLAYPPNYNNPNNNTPDAQGRLTSGKFSKLQCACPALNDVTSWALIPICRGGSVAAFALAPSFLPSFLPSSILACHTTYFHQRRRKTVRKSKSNGDKE